jgi:hypothetical protein
MWLCLVGLVNISVVHYRSSRWLHEPYIFLFASLVISEADFGCVAGMIVSMCLIFYQTFPNIFPGYARGTEVKAKQVLFQAFASITLAKTSHLNTSYSKDGEMNASSLVRGS